jgi:histidinol-phosphate phosphatase family protein
MTRQAIILAGGMGTRLRSRLDGRPKPLVDIDGIPLLGRQIAALRADDFSEILVLVNYAAEQIAAYCAEPAFAGLRLALIDDGEPRGSAGAVLHAFDHLASRFLVVYGDTLFDLDLDRLWRTHEQAEADATLFLHPNDHPGDSDLTETDKDGRVTAFLSPPHDAAANLPNLVNAGLYVMEREAIAFWRTQPIPTDIARDMFPAMLRRGAKLQGYVSFEYIKDIGTPGRLDRAVAQLRAGVVERARRDRPQKAVFLDCDGTITEWRRDLARGDQLVLIDGAAGAVKQFNEAEYRVVIGAGPPILADEETEPAEARRIHGELPSLLGRHGAFVDALYMPRHQPGESSAGEGRAREVSSDCHEPGNELIEDARRDHNIDLGRSWLVGDSTTDILLAARAGLRSILVETGNAGRDGRYAALPDFVARDLAAAARLITRISEPLAEVSRAIVERVAAGDLVLVGGLARQGKSTLTGVLCHELIRSGLDARVLPLDGFLRNFEDRQRGVLGRYDLDLLQGTLAPWLRCEGAVDIEAPIYDRLTRRRVSSGTRLHLTPASVLIVDGVPALLIKAPTSRRIFRIFVDGEAAARERRVVEDLIARGMSPEEARTTNAERAKDETPIVAASIARADIVLSLDPILASSLV